MLASLVHKLENVSMLCVELEGKKAQKICEIIKNYCEYSEIQNDS